MPVPRETLEFAGATAGLILVCLSFVLIVLAGIRYFWSGNKDEQYSAAAIVLFLVQVPFWIFLERIRLDSPVFIPEFCFAFVIVSLILSAYFGARAHSPAGRRAFVATISCLAGYGVFAATLKWGY